MRSDSGVLFFFFATSSMRHINNSKGVQGQGVCMYGEVTVQSNKESLWHKSNQSFSPSVSLFSLGLSLFDSSPREWCHWKKRPLGPYSIKTLWAPKGTHQLSQMSPTAADHFSFAPCLCGIKGSCSLRGSVVCKEGRKCRCKSKQWQREAQWREMPCLLSDAWLWQCKLELTPPSIGVARWPKYGQLER